MDEKFITLAQWVVDATGLRKFDELREELAAIGVSVYAARLKRHLGRFFNEEFVKKRRESGKKHLFQTLKPAISAFLKQQQANGLTSVDESAKARQKKAQKYLMRALQPTIDVYLTHQQTTAAKEEGTGASEQAKKENKIRFQALKPAIDAFLRQQQEAGQMPIDTDVTDQALEDQQWREPVELPRMKKEDVVPAPKHGEETI